MNSMDPAGNWCAQMGVRRHHIGFREPEAEYGIPKGTFGAQV